MAFYSIWFKKKKNKAFKVCSEYLLLVENETKTKKIEMLEKEKEELSEDNTRLAEEKHRMVSNI